MEAAGDAKKKRSLAATSSASTAAGGGVGLTEDHIIDILSRVPAKSVCRFKCVSPSWRNLISDPDNRKMLPQTVTGFFYFDGFDSCTFLSLAKPPPALPPPPMRTGSGSACDFLPENTRGAVVDCCNGLVLLNNSRGGGGGSGSEPRASYIVCNPATKKWTTVPRSTRASKISSASILCFDPAISVHFHVVQLLDPGFNIFSSETGAWVFHRHNSHGCPVADRSRRTFFNGELHFVTDDDRVIAAVDMEGQTRTVIHLPWSMKGETRRRVILPWSGFGGEVQLIGHSQGRLFYVNRDARDTSKLSIYVLGEGESGRSWTLKHCVDTSGLFAGADEYLQSNLLVGVAAVHPHGDSIFLLDSLQGRLMSYVLGSRTVQVIRSSVEASLLWSFVPYVPLYLEMAALENSN